MASDAEILVHVTAPSKTSDDAFYRQLAEAYLNFEPQERIDIVYLEELATTVANPKASDPAAPNGDDDGDDDDEHPAVLAQSFGFEPPPSQQFFEINSQNISFDGALDNRFSPRIRLDQQQQHHYLVPLSQDNEIATQTSWATPPSQISDSYPLAETSAVHTSPTRILQRYIGVRGSQLPHETSFATPQPSRDLRGLSSSRIDVPSSVPDPEAEAEQGENNVAESASVYVDAQKIIPVTPYLTKSATKRKREAAVEKVGGPSPSNPLFDVTHISSTDQSVPPSSRAEVELPSGTNHQRASQRLATSADTSSRNVKTTTGGVKPSRSTASKVDVDSLEILSPSPPPGIADLEPADLISEKLAKLARDLSSRYRATFKREMEPFERGFWLVDCVSWSAEIRSNTWAFLTNYVGSGLAGWGTWCRRAKSHTWLRLYCWGTVAKHTYLLLYLASGRQLKTTVAKWYGVDGEVVIEVPPRE